MMLIILGLILLLTLILYIFKIVKEPFYASGPVLEKTKSNIKNVHENIPSVDPKLVDSIKAGILNTIQNRPDLIETAKQVIAVPEIHRTLMDILQITPNTSTNGRSARSIQRYS